MTPAMRRLGCAAMLALPLCACAGFGTQPRRPFDVATELTALSKECFAQEKIDACAKEKSKDCRDRIVYGQIHAYDLVLSEFEDGLAKASQRINLTGDLITGFATAAGTVVKGAQTKSIVSALATFVTGAKSSADADLFFQKSITTIVARIEALRKEALLPILAGLLKEPKDYSLNLALLDVESYFKSVNLIQALASIDESSKTKETAADKKKNELLNLAFGDDDNSTLLRDFWQPNGKVDPAHAKALQDWIDQHVEPGLPKMAFLSGAMYAHARRQAVADLVK